MVAALRIVDTPSLSETAPPTLVPTTTETFSAWEQVQIARHPNRPHTLDYIRHLCVDFFELHGDRSFADDQAIIGGVGRTSIGTVVALGHQKGGNTHENTRHNFGVPYPEGYRKALRLMRHAEKFGMPLVCFLDASGAQPSVPAEERGQAQAIAQNLMAMASLKTPIVAVVIGEGDSGGALALGLADRLLMLEHAIYSVASPEASAALLWSDVSMASEAASAMKITAQDLLNLGIVDEVIPEPAGGAHVDPDAIMSRTCAAILCHVAHLGRLDLRQLPDRRYTRYRGVGSYYER